MEMLECISRIMKGHEDSLMRCESFIDVLREIHCVCDILNNRVHDCYQTGYLYEEFANIIKDRKLKYQSGYRISTITSIMDNNKFIIEEYIDESIELRDMLSNGIDNLDVELSINRYELFVHTEDEKLVFGLYDDGFYIERLTQSHKDGAITQNIEKYRYSL